MTPINNREQSQMLQKSQSFNVAAHILGDHNVSTKIGEASIIREIQSGRWKEACEDDHGPLDQSLLLLWLGSGENLFISQSSYYQYAGHLPVVPIAQSLVEAGVDPWRQDSQGRDALDQAFALGELDLIKAWLPLAPPHAKLLEKRLFDGHLPWIHAAASLPSDTDEDRKEKMLALLEGVLQLKLSPNQLDEDNNNALFWATGVPVIEKLLAAGVNPHHRNNNQDNASSFWLNSRQITQSTMQLWTRALPKLKKSQMSRNNIVQDFYKSQAEGGKSLLAPLWDKIDLKAGEVNRDGLSPLGVLGDRFKLYCNNSLNGVDKNKLTTWGSWLMAQPKAWDLASVEDIQKITVGALAFGVWFPAIAPFEKMYEHMPEVAHAIKQLVLQLKSSVSKKILHHFNEFLSQCLLKDQNKTLDQQMPLLQMQQWKDMYVEFLLDEARVNFQQGYAFYSKSINTTSDYISINTLVALNLLDQPSMWKLALLVNPHGKKINSLSFEEAWANTLLNGNVPFPNGMEAFIQEQIKEASPENQAKLAFYHRAVIELNTTPSAVTVTYSARPRL